ELLSEAQWEAAARGTDARSYPWGEEEPSQKLANFDGQIGRPSPVGAYPEGAGPYGTLDQAGNVWEWCLDAWDRKAYKNRGRQRDPVVTAEERTERARRVVRGGSWNFPSSSLHTAVRFGFRAAYQRQHVGFRVVVRFGPEHGT
ncbi:MAG TPA: SUMF1/EgtB/PvdO family nonheme iron enzyme, partial [Mycobacterium sp.]